MPLRFTRRPLLPSPRPGWRGRAGFTLIELLVVIGIILIVAGIGVSALRTSPAAALQSAQGTVSSLMTATRAQAAITGRNARLLVWADPNQPETYLRRLAVAYQDDSGNWLTANEGTTLPPGIYVVPQALPVPVKTGVTWPTEASMRSDFSNSGGTPGAMTVNGQGGSFLWIDVTFRGTTFAGRRLLVGTAEITPSGPAFDNPDAVRGFVLSLYAVQTLVNDRASFN
jgi:prepilin-type N-terminal cleavage/methylation domain-containing protein